MRSSIVITSWWSNCLGLTALHKLAAYAPSRELYVMQAGKTDTQMDRFRQFLPTQVTELPYPAELQAEDGPMREYLVRIALQDHDGVWFVDHDTFLLAPATSWFTAADRILAKSEVCLCTVKPYPRAGVTMPAYWASPKRWPQNLSSFNSIPFQTMPCARRPDLHRHNGNLTIPQKDTLVQVREELDALHLAGTICFQQNGADNCLLPVFPPHYHLGGLHLYTGPADPPASLPPSFFEWRRSKILTFERFFNECPKEWLAIEDPELLRRHREASEPFL